MLTKYINLLRKRPDFRNLWLATVVSLTGDWFNTIASVIIVTKYTDSGLAISWIFIARTLPMFLVGPLAGVAADRYNRKMILLISDLIRAGVVLCFLFIDRPERVWLIYLLTTIQFVFSSFYEPTFSAILPTVVEGDKEIVTANILASITWSAMLAIGAALGGVFTTLFGVQAALIADSISFLVSAGFVWRIGVNTTPVGAISKNGFIDLLDGAKFVGRRLDIFALAGVKALGQIGSGDVIMAIYARSIFPMGLDGAKALGIMFTAGGIGAILGPIIGNLLMKEDDRNDLYKSILIGFIVIPVGWALVWMGQNIWVVSLGFIIRFMGGSANWTYSSVLLQFETPNKFLGRVFALDMAMFTLVSSLSVWVLGFVLDTYGIAPRQLVLYIVLGNFIPVFVWSGRMLRMKPKMPARSV